MPLNCSYDTDKYPKSKSPSTNSGQNATDKRQSLPDESNWK